MLSYEATAKKVVSRKKVVSYAANSLTSFPEEKLNSFEAHTLVENTEARYQHGKWQLKILYLLKKFSYQESMTQHFSGFHYPDNSCINLQAPSTFSMVQSWEYIG